MRIIVNGAGGQMGKVLCAMIEEKAETEIAARVSMEFSTDAAQHIYADIKECTESADCIIDFSNHTAVPALCAYAVETKLPLVIATTGLTADEQAAADKAAETVPVFQSANMSLGVALVACLAKIAAKALPDANIEIVEAHHNRKLDVPSGTALLLADAIKSVRPESTYNIGRHEYGKRTSEEIGIHSLRLGGEVGMHEIQFATGTQVITLKHQAQTRALFAEGALSAAAFLVKQPAGHYNMDDIFA